MFICESQMQQKQQKQQEDKCVWQQTFFDTFPIEACFTRSSICLGYYRGGPTHLNEGA